MQWALPHMWRGMAVARSEHALSVDSEGGGSQAAGGAHAGICYPYAVYTAVVCVRSGYPAHVRDYANQTDLACSSYILPPQHSPSNARALDLSISRSRLLPLTGSLVLSRSLSFSLSLALSRSLALSLSLSLSRSLVFSCSLSLALLHARSLFLCTSAARARHTEIYMV